MSDLFNTLDHNDLIEGLRNLVSKGRQLESQILLYLAEVKDRKLFALMGYSNLALFCKEVLGMGEDSAWKRSQAVNVMTSFPELFHMLEQGETHLSQVAMLAPRMTEANADMILDFLPGKTKRELEAFLSRVTNDGHLTEGVETVTVKLKLDLKTAELLDKALSLATNNRTAPGQLVNEGVKEILEEYLEKHDPERKAERNLGKRPLTLVASRCRETMFRDATCPERSEGIPSNQPLTQGDPFGLRPQDTSLSLSRQGLAKQESSTLESIAPGQLSEKVPSISRYVPAQVRYQVFARNNHQCSYISPQGTRCQEKKYLEIEHINPIARGGTHDISNLKVLCKTHNQFVADQVFGEKFMQRKRL